MSLWLDSDYDYEHEHEHESSFMIVYYISSHGYGHAVRAGNVIRELAPALPLTLRTPLPEWILRQELAGRPCALAPAEFDCGVLGPDAMRVDVTRTVDRLERLLAENEARLESEIKFLRDCGARLVVSDIPSFPLRVAAAAGLPSVLIANFTWCAIYEHLARGCADPILAARLRRASDVVQCEYDQGGLLLATDMALPMHACRERREVPLIARRGRNRRAELAATLGFDPSRPIGLIYLGREGMDGIDWSRLAKLDVQLASYAPPPESLGVPALAGIPAKAGTPKQTTGRIHRLDESRFGHTDATSSVDIVIAKCGYATCSECIAAGTPMIYPPRPEFGEMDAVNDLMMRWGGGLLIEDRDFRELNWQPALDRLLEKKRKFNPMDCTGATLCARAIEEIYI